MQVWPNGTRPVGAQSKQLQRPCDNAESESLAFKKRGMRR